jgi:hypothetical protein
MSIKLELLHKDYALLKLLLFGSTSCNARFSSCFTPLAPHGVLFEWQLILSNEKQAGFLNMLSLINELFI